MSAEVIIFPGSGKRERAEPKDFHEIIDDMLKNRPTSYACPSCFRDRWWALSSGELQCAYCLRISEAVGCHSLEMPVGA
jgi:hypothetical protein